MGLRFFFVIYLLFLIFFLYIPSVEAISFIKYSSLALSIGDIGTWDDSYVNGPTILFEDKLYKMWYSGDNGNKRQIGFADSSSPYTFQKKINPVLFWDFISTGDIGIEHPSILHQDVYKIWFSNVQLNFINFRLYYSSSIDGIVWYQAQELLFNSPFTSWDSTGMGAPSVIFIPQKNIYYMWYSARGSLNGFTRWRLGYAVSSDGINWTKNPAPILWATDAWEGSDVGNPSVIFDESTGNYEMFYHGDFGIGRATSPDGINWTKDPANPILTPTADTFDSVRVLNPFVLKKDGIYYMWYTGINSEGKWQIGLATSEPIPTPLPTAIPTTTPTITPTVTPSIIPTSTPTITPALTPSITITPTLPPSPTPTLNQSASPVIIIPGLGASWNPKDIFSCSLEPGNKWELAPYVSLYNRLMNTLIDNAHLQLNQDVYLYTYDWRQPLDKQAEYFKTYLENILITKPIGTKVRLVGHSLGGLVIRSYLANYPDTNHILSVMTVGTPHLGTLAAYPIWEKGEIAVSDLLLQLTINQVIANCKVVRTFILPQKSILIKKFRTNREIVQYFVPVMKQLLPVFNYLRMGGQIKDTSTLANKNDWISSHPFPHDNYNVDFSTLSGKDVDTLRFFDITNPSIREGAFGDWIDGKPLGSQMDTEGDGTVLNLSSRIEGTNNQIIPGNHAELIYSDAGIVRILNFLGLPDVPVAPAVIPPEEVSQNALMISLLSEAQLKITDPRGNILAAKDNIFVSYNPPIGLYRLEILSNKSSENYIHVSQITKNQEARENEFNLSQDIKRPRRFYLIYNPISASHLQLIPL